MFLKPPTRSVDFNLTLNLCLRRQLGALLQTYLKQIPQEQSVTLLFAAHLRHGQSHLIESQPDQLG